MTFSEHLARGTVIREPAGRESGYWAGCPGAYYDAAERAWYLTYRLRRPRGVDPDRGGEVRIARSTNLETWDDILSLTKDRYDSASIERSCLHRGPDGRWHYFTSYVNPADGRWCTAMMSAAKVAELDPAKRTVIFTGPKIALEGVKDPWLMERDGVFLLFLSVATPTAKTAEDSHATLDIFNTGECKSATGLAISRDLQRWEWQGIVFAPGAAGWDQYCRRINSVAALPAESGKPARFLAFYDGSGSHLDNYEEKCGLAVSEDLQRWQTLSPQGPVVTSPHATKSLRYVDAKFANGKWHLFYEFAREDGAHDLRVATCAPSDFAQLLAPVAGS